MNKLRVGIIGCGEVTQIMHLPSLIQLKDYFEVTAISDASQTVVDGVGEQWNIRKRFLDERDLLAQDDVDAVLIASPSHYHARSAIYAAEAGKHVLVEKPMCYTLREADEVSAAAKKAGVTVQVAYMRRYAPAFVEACRLVRELDSIRFARVHDIIGRNASIVERTSRVIKGKDIPVAALDASRAAESALMDEALGSFTPELGRAYGILLGLASHDVSAMRELLDEPRGTLYAAHRHGGTYVTAALDYGDFICHVEIGVDQIPRYDTYLQVYGNDKIVQVRYDTPYVRHLPTRLIITEAAGDRVTHSDANPAWSDNFTMEWIAFYENITQQRAPKSSPEDFRKDLELFADMVRLMRQQAVAVAGHEKREGTEHQWQ